MSGSSKQEDFLNKLNKSGEVQITVAGRKSGEKHSTPVWFVSEGNNVEIVPIKGSQSDWFKNLEKDPQIELSVGRERISSKAKLVKDAEKTKKVIEKLKAKYKSEWSESYYSNRNAYVQVPV